MSFILTQIIKKKLPEWNERFFIEEDFYFLCQREQVRVMESEKFKHKGEYSIHKDICFILLNKKLNCGEKLWVGLHEFGHHLLHYPVNHRFSKGTRRRMDREANFFAAVALIPTFLIEENMLVGLSVREALGIIVEEFGYPKDLIKIRQEIYETYKI